MGTFIHRGAAALERIALPAGGSDVVAADAAEDGGAVVPSDNSEVPGPFGSSGEFASLQLPLLAGRYPLLVESIRAHRRANH